MSQGRFRLVIDLGNDEMRTRKHIAGALRSVAYKLENGHESGKIRDENGNTVGEFAVYE